MKYDYPFKISIEKADFIDKMKINLPVSQKHIDQLTKQIF